MSDAHYDHAADMDNHEDKGEISEELVNFLKLAFSLAVFLSAFLFTVVALDRQLLHVLRPIRIEPRRDDR